MDGERDKVAGRTCSFAFSADAIPICSAWTIAPIAVSSVAVREAAQPGAGSACRFGCRTIAAPRVCGRAVPSGGLLGYGLAGVMAESLDQIACQYGTDKASNVHGFTAVYEPLFTPFRDTPITLLEIGVKTGASLHMWEDYFPVAQIVGIDNKPEAITHPLSDRVSVMVGDQADRDFLLSVAANHGPFGIVIDDGGHEPDQQLTSLLTLWPHVSPGGIYAVEDIHTSYLERHPDGWRPVGQLREGTMIEAVKSIIDDVNRKWHSQPVTLEDLASLHVYLELAVFVKRVTAPPH
jgi:hypothetical protein